METKTCTRCKSIQNHSSFYKQKQTGAKGQTWEYLDSMCIACRSSYTTERRRDTKRKIVEYLGGKCVDCGLVDDPVVYDCHHLEPGGKDFSLGKNMKRFEAIKGELDKCILLCCLCHRKRHFLVDWQVAPK